MKLVKNLLSLCLMVLVAACSSKPDVEIKKIYDTTQIYSFVLVRQPGETKYALADYSEDRSQNPIEYLTEAIFDGTFQPLNLESVKGSDEMYVLDAGDKKYLVDEITGLMLNGKPFNEISQDNLGGCRLVTDEGVIYFTNQDDAPQCVDDYYRLMSDGREYFIYSQNGKCGVNHQVADISFGHNYVDYGSKIEEFFPCEFDSLIVVHSDYALHFVASKDGVTSLLNRFKNQSLVYYDHWENWYKLVQRPGGIGYQGEAELANEYISELQSLAEGEETQLKYFPTSGKLTKYGDLIKVYHLGDYEGEDTRRFIGPDVW